jgi:hypothetical protein
MLKRATYHQGFEGSGYGSGLFCGNLKFADKSADKTAFRSRKSKPVNGFEPSTY